MTWKIELKSDECPYRVGLHNYCDCPSIPTDLYTECSKKDCPLKMKNYYKRHMTYKEWYEKGGRLRGGRPFEKWYRVTDDWLAGFKEGSKSAWLYQANMWGRKKKYDKSA